jgi:hypothetical protein
MDQEINIGHYFELMDRCHCMSGNLYDNIATHPALDKENLDKVDKAIDLLQEVYQWAGKKHYEMELISPHPTVESPTNE